MPIQNDGIMVILSSPSGAGKTTLVSLLSKLDNFEISISHTTRKPRPNEIDGTVEGASQASTNVSNLPKHYDFDGTNDYVEIDHDSVFNLTDSISIALWFNWDTNLDDSHSLVSTRTSLSGAGGFELMTYNDYVAFAFNDPDSDEEYNCDSTSFLASNTWHHVAVTYDGSNIKIYNNGTLETEIESYYDSNN